MTKIATREAYGQALVAVGTENRDIVVLDADLAKSTKTIDFKKRFPERFFDLGVAEANMIGTAAGLAASGKIPFCSTFAVFATGRAYDQIRQSVAYPRLNVKIAATHAGITVGEDGGSHQSVEDIALMRVLPHMTVFVPADAVETAAAVRAATQIDGPVYLRLGRLGVPLLYKDDYQFVPGKAVEMRRGSDATIIACGLMVSQAMEAVELLKADGIDAGVLNIHTLKPLDVQAIVDAAQRTGAIVTAEEHSIIGGLGSAVAETLAEHYPVPMVRVGLRDVFGESAKPDELLRAYALTPADISNAVMGLL